MNYRCYTLPEKSQIHTAARQDGWWTNFGAKEKPAYDHLVVAYKGPGTAVIKEAVPSHYGDFSLWIEPPPSDWQAVNDAIRATDFWKIHDPLVLS